MTTKLITPANAQASEVDRRQLWKAAIKLPMYSVAVVPIWVGTALAWGKSGQLDGLSFATFLGAAILILAWLNLSNDVFDADTGIDSNKAHSVVNLTGNRSLVFWISNICLLMGILGIFALSYRQQDATVIGLVILCCVLGYSYQGPPFRLGYQGLGEIICFVCFGPLAIAAAYYSQTQLWSWQSLGPAAIVGLTTSLILFCSHFHQVEDDRAAGKKSPIVRLGTALAAQIVPWWCALIYGITGLLVALHLMPVGSLLLLVSVPWAWQLTRQVLAHHHQPMIIHTCKFMAVKLHFWSGLLLGLGLLLR